MEAKVEKPKAVQYQFCELIVLPRLTKYILEIQDENDPSKSIDEIENRI
jgi:hypothetical protein